jgi:hypothetical protein
MNKHRALCAAAVLLAVSLLAPAPASAQGKKDFDALVTELVDQIEVQIEARQKLITKLEAMYKELTDAAQQSFENSQSIMRSSEIMRDAILTSDGIIRDQEAGVIVPIKEFLERAIDRDQAFFNSYQEQYDRIRFGYERELANLKGEQTLLKAIRRDLETVRNYPDGKDRSLFFLNSVKAVLNSLETGTK